MQPGTINKIVNDEQKIAFNFYPWAYFQVLNYFSACAQTSKIALWSMELEANYNFYNKMCGAIMHMLPLQVVMSLPSLAVPTMRARPFDGMLERASFLSVKPKPYPHTTQGSDFKILCTYICY